MLVIKDFATTILASALTAAATSVVVSDASRLPALSAGDYYYLVLQKFTDRTNVEVVKVTGATGNTLTVVRAQAGTTAKSFAIGDYAEQRVTVGTFSEYIAQSVAGKVDKSGAVVEQSLSFLSTGDLVSAGVGIAYEANRHVTALGGGVGANTVNPFVALRPLGKDNSSVQAIYDFNGNFALLGGERKAEIGKLVSLTPADAFGWPNATANNANNYNTRFRQKFSAGNNAIYIFGDGADNARRFGIQSGHESPAYANLYGILDLNPFGGTVMVNGGTVYHTKYVPTPAAVGALALVGGTLTGPLAISPAVGINPLDLASIPNPAGTSAQGVAGWDSTGATREWGVGRYAANGVAEYAYFGFGVAPWNSGLRVYGAGDLRAGAVNRLYHEGYLPTPDTLGAVPQARTINSKPLTANITLSAADVGAVAKIGDTMTGGLTFVNADCELGWVFNSDYAKIGFKNTADGDTDSYMWFKTGDNGNEYFKWQSVSGANTTDWMSLKPTGLVVAAGVTAPTFTGALAGNAATATKLATARQINGTDFDGSGNITTANWGTARTLTIGNAAKSVNGAGNVSWSLAEIGAARSAGEVSSGASVNITTDQFVQWLKNLGAFNERVWIARCNWHYAGNKTITDTGCGNIHLAGCTIEVISTSESNYTIRVVTPTTSAYSGTTGAEFIYVNNGPEYSPGWRRIYTTSNKPTASDVGALPVAGGTVSGMLGVTGILDLVGSSASDMAAIVWSAPDGTERGRLWVGGTIGADNSLTWRSGASGATYKIYHEGNKPTASDVGAAPAGFGLGEYGRALGSVLGDTSLRRQSGFYQGYNIEGLPTSPHSWNYVFSQAHANAAGFFGYLAINFDCSKAWIGGQFGGGQRGPFELVKQRDRFVAMDAVGNDYNQCAVEVNGNTAIDSRPGIGFHMAGRFASTLHLWEGGDFRFHGQGLGSYAGIMTGNVNANDVYIRSDRRLKKNLVEVRDALRKVSSLTAYSYDKKQTLEATEYDKKEVGLIAQDVEQVLPEAVTRVVDSSNKDGTEILTLSNSALIALLVGAVKELSEKVKELEYGRT